MRVQLPWRRRPPEDPMKVLDSIIDKAMIDEIKVVVIESRSFLKIDLFTDIAIVVGYVLLEIFLEGGVLGSATRILLLGVLWMLTHRKRWRVNRQLKQVAGLLEHLHDVTRLEDLVDRHNESSVRVSRALNGEVNAISWREALGSKLDTTPRP